MPDEILYDGPDRRKKQERPVNEGYLGPEYQHDRYTGIERRQTEHEKRLVRIDAKVDKIESKLDEHGEILRGIGESFTPLINVLDALTDWATVFGYVMQFVRWCAGPVGRKLIVFVVLLWYYIKTGNLEVIVKAIVG